MGWLSRLRGPQDPAPATGGGPEDVAPDNVAPGDVFVCADCGRTDLPEAGGWDPPICLECDAAINEDALYETGIYDDL